MFKDIYKRLGIQILIYLVILYLVPWFSIEFLSNNASSIVTALFLVIFNLLIIIAIASIDSYKYKLNYFMWLIPGLLFIPTAYLFYTSDWLVYSLLYSFSYGRGMLLGWSYKTYGYQLKPGYKKVHKEERAKYKEEKAKKKTTTKSKKK